MNNDQQYSLLKSFGAVVRQRRQEMGLSQEELAAKAGLNRTYIGDIERGTRNVALVNIFRLALALEIKPSFLLMSIEKRVRKTGGR
ncbi:MAG: helix-turn-helix transcriptional regulator [Planctomycetota bacterium]